MYNAFKTLGGAQKSDASEKPKSPRVTFDTVVPSAGGKHGKKDIFGLTTEPPKPAVPLSQTRVPDSSRVAVSRRENLEASCVARPQNTSKRQEIFRFVGKKQVGEQSH